MNKLVQGTLETHVYPCLDSEHALMQARACWVYEQYGRFDFQEKAHLIAAANRIVNHLHHTHVVVRVYAAFALARLLDHEEVVQLIRPNLGHMLRLFLRIMDEMDLEELVGALSKIVDVYGEELAPYAVSLCQKLSEAYLRLLAQSGSIHD